MKLSKGFASLVLCAYAPAFAAPSPAPLVDLGFARYQGILVQDAVTNQTNTNFLGMRFAAPPIGQLRFREPQSPAFTPGVQMANAQPMGCLAAGAGSSPVTPFRIGAAESFGRRMDRRSDDLATSTTSDDCLFLNVFVPGQLGENKNLPVVFWIHGGGYVGGSASGFTGNDLLRESGGGVIAVVIQYRLGLFGFLSGQKVKDGGALNAGLLDQQFALKWVQQHIGKFGGDPNKVTIWGESAGAGSVIQHVVANGGRTNPPLFRAGMTSSTYLPSQYPFNDRIPELLYSEVITQTNCSSASDTLDCLRAADVGLLQAANVKISSSGFFGTFIFVPVVDGTFITARPTELLKQGKLNGQIVLSVTNANEGIAFVNQSTANTVQVPQYIAQLFPNLTPIETEAAAAQYAGLGSNIVQVNAIMSESIFLCPTYSLLRAFGGLGFKGEFAIPPGTHAEDVAYYFPSLNAAGVPGFANPDFDKAFSESFLNFVLSLNPNVKWDPTNITPLWKPWGGLNEMLFNMTAAGLPDVRLIETASGVLARCNFWESVSASAAQ
ncbi:Alpha/Beta hydrolase protein [Flammula alnicola]|nr:Alpha/Beta hydrolase protein [Flammula alnicola]